METDTVVDTEAWKGFVPGNRTETIDVHDFIQKDYTPYEGDASLLASPTEETLHVWDTLEKEYPSEERKRRVYDVDTKILADTDALPADYISEGDDVCVGFQADVSLKHAMTPNDGWRMVETVIREASKELDPEVREILTRYRKMHNDAAFDIYTPRIRAVRSPHVIIGLPSACGHGRIIGDCRRVALYGVDCLIKKKQAVKDSVMDAPLSEHRDRYREEHTGQTKVLKKLKAMTVVYGLGIPGPAKNIKETVQWIYFAYLALVKSQDGVVMSIGRLSAFFNIYFERDLKVEFITEVDAQEAADVIVIKLRVVHFLRTTDYGQIFSGDPYWAAWSDTDFGDDGHTLVTRTAFRLFQMPRNLGLAPEPNVTIFWDFAPPAGHKNFCAVISIETSSIQYEPGPQTRDRWGDDATIAYYVSPVRVGKQMQLFGARANTAKASLYAINGGYGEMLGKQIVERFEPVQSDGSLESSDVWNKYEETLDRVVDAYVEALNTVHYCHDRHAYESIEMALRDSDIMCTMGYGIIGLSIVTDLLSAIKYAKVTPIRDETGLVVDYEAVGSSPRYSNDGDRADNIAATVVHTVVGKIRAIPLYRGAIPVWSVLTITSNITYGKAMGSSPSSRRKGTSFDPGANLENGAGTHGMPASTLSVGRLDHEDALDGISPMNTTTPSGLGRDGDEQVENLVQVSNGGFIPEDSFLS